MKWRFSFRRGLLGAFAVLILTSGAVSCGFFAVTDQVLVSFPPGNVCAGSAGSLERWNVCWTGEGGDVYSRTVEKGRALQMRVPRECPLILAAYPVLQVNTAFCLKPAGCVLSALERPAAGLRISLNWVDGFAAEFLLGLAEQGADPASLNIARFRREASFRSLGNPWTLDAVKLAEDVCGGRLRVYSFKLLPVHNVALPLPAGKWYSDFPPEPYMESGPSGWNGPLTEGLHRFYRPADNTAALASVNAEGAAVLQIVPPEVLP